MRDMVRCALRDPVAGALGGALRRGSGEVKVVAVSDEEEGTVGTVVEGRGGGVGAGLLACIPELSGSIVGVAGPSSLERASDRTGALVVASGGGEGADVGRVRPGREEDDEEEAATTGTCVASVAERPGLVSSATEEASTGLSAATNSNLQQQLIPPCS